MKQALTGEGPLDPRRIAKALLTTSEDLALAVGPGNDAKLREARE
ncbi:hypothetical protein [Sphingobium psychrophilum]|nr:hypothetical protein [Sphingobium psychrophilum]